MFWRAVTLIIAVLLAAVAGAVYWFGLRPLPETSGQISGPVSAAGTISRDARGVPHIQAATIDDALFLQGYAMAQDRLWQMDGLRRRAAGELSEIVGPVALESDRDARRLGIAHTAEFQEQNLSPEDRRVLAAFARGVNFFIDTHRGKYPLEFTLLGYTPKPWTVRDSVLAGMEMYRTLTTTWRAEIAKQNMREQGDPAKVDFLFPLRSGIDRQPGSNAWVISGDHTASGKPLLSNDPHLEYALPSPWHLVHLQASGLDVMGATIVGLPGVVTGHNQNIAWGVTNLEFDVQDLYREQIDLQTGQYTFHGKPAQAQKREETILVKNAPPEKFENWITLHGPLLVEDHGAQYSLRWSAMEKSAFTYPFLDLNRAHNWDEFRAALKRFGGPGQNFVYADKLGNIGYQATGRLPRRKTCRGDVPSGGAKGDCEWDGFVAFDAMPSIYNPPGGRIATANQNPFPEHEDYLVNGNFAAPYRARQIHARLAAREQWKPQEMLSVQSDIYSEFAQTLAQELVAAAEHKKLNNEATDLLRKWNGQMDPKQPAPMIVMLTYAQLRKALLDRAAPGLDEKYQALIPASGIARALREHPKHWFADYDETLTQALTQGIVEGTKAQGSDISRWQWGLLQALTIVNPVVGRLPLIGHFFNIGPTPMQGAPTTVFQYTGRLGPSLRITADLSDWDHSLMNLATGESGQVFSPHYQDQWDAYRQARSFPMQFEKVDVKEVLRVEPAK